MTVVLIPKEDRMEMRIEYPTPIDRPQVSGDQGPKGSWRYDDKSWFAEWKFTLPKSPNMKAQAPGIMIDPEADETLLCKTRKAWFIKRKDHDLAWSVNTSPPWEDHTVPSLGHFNQVARDNRAHMINTHELYYREFCVTMVNRDRPVPEG